MKTILNNPNITIESRHFIDNYFCKLDKLLVNNEESEAKEIFLKNHYLLIDVYAIANMKIVLPDEDISDSDEKESFGAFAPNIKLIPSKKKEQKPRINISQNKPEPKFNIPQNDVLNQAFVTFEEQHSSTLTNKNLLR